MDVNSKAQVRKICSLEHQVKLGHRYSQISTDIWLFVAFNILVIRVHPCPQNGNSYTFELDS